MEEKQQKVEDMMDESVKLEDEVLDDSPEQEIENKNNLKEEYNNLMSKYHGDYYSALFEFCFIHNIFYTGDTVKLLLEGKGDEVYALMPQLYIDTIESDFRFEGQTFFSQLKRNNFEKIYSEDLSLLGLSDDDKKNRMQIIEIYGYDPFKEDKIEDKPQLYRDLVGMTNENMRKDIAKQKAALSIVRGYSNIENYQKQVNTLTASGQVDEGTQKQLDQLMKAMSNIQASLNQTAEKNNFTTKGIGSNGKGMLSDVMNQIEEKGIDEGITNFYDIATSKSIEEVANISMKAQLNQVNLSKTDYADILSEQCVIVKESQKTARNAVEALRLAKEKIVKQKLLEELEQDYRKKGISEEEIVEFINREYHLFDGKD